MPRHRPRLGQGLEALVSPARNQPLAEPTVTAPSPEQPVQAVGDVVAWEYAILAARKPKRGRRPDCWISILPGDLLHKPARRKRRGGPPMGARGALGAGGWELTAVRGRRYVLKRAVCTSPNGAGLRPLYLA